MLIIKLFLNKAIIRDLDYQRLPRTDSSVNPSAFKSFVPTYFKTIEVFSLIFHLLVVD